MKNLNASGGTVGLLGVLSSSIPLSENSLVGVIRVEYPLPLLYGVLYKLRSYVGGVSCLYVRGAEKG